MGLLKDWQGSRYTMHLFIIKLVCCLGWLSAAFGQMELGETVSSAASFTAIGITCLGNAALFFSSVLRGGLYLEMGARDALTMLTGRIKLKSIQGWEDIHGFGLTTCRDKLLSDCSVIMLSLKSPNRSMRQFIEYIANVYNVRSILLQYLPLSSLPLTLEICSCPWPLTCSCIVFWGGVDEAITLMLAEQIPRTIKRLSDSLCLLPCLDCLKNGCHGCNHALYVENDFGEKKLTEGDPNLDCAAAVCGAPYLPILEEPATCICIPVLQEGYDRGSDRWTELLIRCFKSKDYETRGVIIREESKSSISHDLENYMGRSGKCYAEEEYSDVSLIVPRVTEILINLFLTFWFKVDGFSSALVARRVVRDYIVDGRGRGFAAHVFITKAVVRSNDNSTNVYQVLSFRGNRTNPKTLSVIVGCVNLICSLIWVVLVSLEGGPNKWYRTHSMPLSVHGKCVLFIGVAIAIFMDIFDVVVGWFQRYGKDVYTPDRVLINSEGTDPGRCRFIRLPRKLVLVYTMTFLEAMFMLSTTLASGLMFMLSTTMHVHGRWVYCAVHCLVWVKWGVGSYLLGQYTPQNKMPGWMYGSTGVYMYSSAFLLNAFLAGVRAKWEF